MIRFEKDSNDDIFVWTGEKYIGLICPHGSFYKYQVVIDGKVLYSTNSLLKSKVVLLFKYFVKRIFGL